MFQLTNYLVEAIEPLVNSLSFLFACLLLFICAWSVLGALIDAIARAKRMHQIPCTQCRFFTNNYRLKCTVNPYIANTEEAIECSEYRSN